MPTEPARPMLEKCTDTWITTPKKLLSAATREACLVHIYPTGPNMGRRYPLHSHHPLTLGRGEDADIRITDNSVSRRHAIVEPNQEGFFVADQHSTNGTFVNDKQLDGPWMLQDGDYVRVGNCLYRFLAGGNIEAEYHEEIYRLTILDGLTQLHNGRYLNEFLDREVLRSQRHNRPLAVLALDIDKFKALNDTRGHLCGDFVLRELGAVLRDTTRQEDLAARCGGEEFVVVLVETTADEAIKAAERVRAAVEEHTFRFESARIKLTVSVGVASTMGDATATATALRKIADERLYRAKHAGRNRVCG